MALPPQPASIRTRDDTRRLPRIPACHSRARDRLEYGEDDQMATQENRGCGIGCWDRRPSTWGFLPEPTRPDRAAIVADRSQPMEFRAVGQLVSVSRLPRRTC